MKRLFAAIALAALAACSIADSQTASDAKKQLVGKTQDQILQCMGVPNGIATTEGLEMWSYDSGGSVAGIKRRYCTVNVAFKGGKVASVSYTGRTGGLITKDAECAPAVEACL